MNRDGMAGVIRFGCHVPPAAPFVQKRDARASRSQEHLGGLDYGLQGVIQVQRSAQFLKYVIQSTQPPCQRPAALHLRVFTP
jgi:hypothetical protein